MRPTAATGHRPEPAVSSCGPWANLGGPSRPPTVSCDFHNDKAMRVCGFAASSHAWRYLSNGSPPLWTPSIPEDFQERLQNFGRFTPDDDRLNAAMPRPIKGLVNRGALKSIKRARQCACPLTASSDITRQWGSSRTSRRLPHLHLGRRRTPEFHWPHSSPIHQLG
jgi:hypothetical protein